MSSNEPKRSRPWSDFASVWSGFSTWLRARSRGEAWSLAVIALATLSVAGIAGVALGYVAAKQSIPHRVRSSVQSWLAGMQGPQDRLAVEHLARSSIYHNLDIARLPLGRAWSIEEVDGRILFSSRLGRLGYVTPDFRVVSLNLEAPMNLEGLRTSNLARNDLFEIAHFRVTDLLSVPTGQGEHDLYVAHHLYDNADCIRVAVDHIRLRIGESGEIEAVSPNWDQVFRSRDCVQAKPVGVYYSGTQSGGRLVRLDEDRLALSTGDFQFDGFTAPETYSMNPESDLGKIIEITLSTRRARVLASGFRNPQGLLMSRDGTLFATDHGPRGGDEVNIVRPGANYGWPIGTYGLRYASRPIPWSPSLGVGNHEGYEQPLFAFVPSVGISNLIEPDPREFPNWSGDLLVASLRRNTLHRLRLRDGRVLFSEPIVIDGVRIRDMLSLGDGRIALAGDEGDIHILSNAELEDRHSTPAELAGLNGLPPVRPGEVGGITDPARQGAGPFGLYCAQCHSVNGEVRVGPPLNGIVGRRVGGYEGFEYSEALTGRRERWTRDRLRRFALDPQAVYPGTSMEPIHPPADDLEQMIEYLASTRASRRTDRGQGTR